MTIRLGNRRVYFCLGNFRANPDRHAVAHHEVEDQSICDAGECHYVASHLELDQIVEGTSYDWTNDTSHSLSALEET